MDRVRFDELGVRLLTRAASSDTYTLAVKAEVCSSVRREHSVLPFTVITPCGLGILRFSEA